MLARGCAAEYTEFVVERTDINLKHRLPRTLRPEPDDPSNLLPVERACAHTIDRSILDPARLRRDRIAEIPRLAIVPGFRRRHGEQHTAIAVSEADFGEVDLPRSVRPLWDLICEQIWTGFERRGATLH